MMFGKADWRCLAAVPIGGVNSGGLAGTLRAIHLQLPIVICCCQRLSE